MFFFNDGLLYENLNHFRNLSESALNRMAVINPSHRQAILSKSKGVSGGTSKAGGGVDFGDDFDALLGDLTSAIADLESLAVVSCLD